MAVGAAAVKVVERAEPAEEPAPARQAEVVPLHEGVSLLDLKASSCRWPLGDPAEEGFVFCGAKTAPGETYCKCHAEVAFPARAKPRK
jgi:GcrA cell cycle regulator